MAAVNEPETAKHMMACGHACVMYAGTKSTAKTKCCECLHTETSAPTIYIDGLGEQACPRWQF